MKKINLNKIINFLIGLAIIFLIYYIAVFVLKILKINFPPVILGLIFFTLALNFGIIKEKYIETTVNFLLKNMAILFVPFVVGIIKYKELLLENWLMILLVVFLTTFLIIVSLGLFVEYGLKFLRLHKINKYKGVKND